MSPADTAGETAGENNEASQADSGAKSGASARTVVGRVISNKMDKTVTVAVERLIRHPVYGKFIRRTTKLMAHDEANSCQPGDRVAIAECRPYSRHKSWRVVEVVTRVSSPAEASQGATPGTGA